MSENEGRAARNRKCETVHAGLFVRPGKDVEMARLAAVPVCLHSRDLDRLVFQRLEALLVPEQQLKRRKDGREADRHAQHGASFLDVSACKEISRANRQHYKSGGQVRRVEHMPKSIAQSWIDNA